jgi:hypothetical protein
MSAPENQRVWRLIGSALGVALLLAACWVLWTQRDQLADALAHMRRQGGTAWVLGAALVLLPWASWLLTGLMYWLLMNTQREPARVRLGEMLAVIGAAWLLNYLPLRPGMAGRLAYHASVNGIPLKEGVARSVLAVSCGGVGVLALIIALLVAKVVEARTMLATTMLLAGPLLGLAGTSLLVARRDLARRYVLACAVRYLDVLSWMGRYLCAFALLGRPLALFEAAILTAISQAAMVVPFVSNGLGLREWAVALLGPMLPAWVRASGTSSVGALTKTTSLAGDVLHRVGDVLAAIPVGLWGAWVVSRRVREKGATLSGSPQ